MKKLLIVLILLVGSFSLFADTDKNIKQAHLRSNWKIVDKKSYYSTKVQPIFDKKCIACHSCYNSPCQLNLTSLDGLKRGASHENLYDFPLIEARDPSRLYVDAKSAKQWHKKGFFSVVNKKASNLLLRMITLEHGVESGLQEKYDSEYSRYCIEDSSDGLEKFTKKNPAGRMPFGFYKLSAKEVQTISNWSLNIFDGPSTAALEKQVTTQKALNKHIIQWESFLNNEGIKNKILARYLYEHFFIADLYFSDFPNVFFKLVRSSTKTGEIKQIPTTFVFDKIDKKFFYRLRPVTNTIVHKSHIPLEINSKVLAKWKKWFLDIPWNYDPKVLPEYGEKGSNAFATFEAIPAKSRYKLFLDNSAYFIMTFIKGPVCRGQTALNVINDHFWVLFLDPEVDILSNSKQAYQAVSMRTEFPAKEGDKFDLFADFKDKYWNAVEEKYKYLAKNQTLNFDSLWTGNKTNKNSLITVMRHFDSATVLQGLRGKTPKTIWVLDYHVFESIYYNLVAGYNVFGPILHQVNSRLYMEVSRIASEDLFISFLPKDKRHDYRKQWNLKVPKAKSSITKELVDLFSKDAKDKLTSEYVYAGSSLKTAIKFSSKEPKEEFLNKVISQLYSPKQTQLAKNEEKIVKKLQNISKASLEHLPDTVFLYLEDKDELYTIVHNKDHYNVASLMFEQERRRPEKDSLTVIKGAGASYINSIVAINSKFVDLFANDLGKVRSKKQMNQFLKKYMTSRSSPYFWDYYEKVSKKAYNSETNERGYLDLNRYINL